MKTTLICMHVMPMELELLENSIKNFRNALQYLDEKDSVTFKITLNLNPELTDWENSILKQEYFINEFNRICEGLPHINEIITDTSLWGTTQQKRECIELDFDQFIFCDADIVFSEELLKNQLNVSYQLEDRYIVSPSIPRWWDYSWDTLCDSRFMNAPLGAAQSKEVVEGTTQQDTNNIVVRQIYTLKFGCGMHTLYSKEFWKLIGIPDAFGGYGPEDTFAMGVGNKIHHAYPIMQLVLDGLYITEDIFNRIPSFADKITTTHDKLGFKNKALSIIAKEVNETILRILNS